MNKSITVLGSTGSIGRQTLDVAKNLNLKVTGLCAQSSVALLEQQAREFNPRCVAIGDSSLYGSMKTALADTDIKVTAGEQAIEELAAEKADVVLDSIVGIAGLGAALSACKAGNTLALANKEALVTGGKLVTEAAKHNNVEIIPVDSEHSAIFQCLNGENRDRIKRIILTASGGPFFGRKSDELKNITPAQALKHPNWSMGRKISIDSATLMNKGLELIEAMHLFAVGADKIDIHVHRQSIIHSAVEFSDGAVMAQLGTADMRIPIQYAVTYPDRLPSPAKPLSLFETGALTFERPDTETFKCLKAAMEAAKLGGLYPCAVNGANEQAVALFLDNKIDFLQIGELVSKALQLDLKETELTVENVYAVDKAARELVLSNI